MERNHLWLLLSIVAITSARGETNRNCSAETHEETYVGELQKRLAAKHTAEHELTELLLKAKIIAAAAGTTAQKLQAQAIANLYQRWIDKERKTRRSAAITELTALADMSIHMGRHDALKPQVTAAIRAVNEADTSGGGADVKGITLVGGTPGITQSKCHITEYIAAQNTGSKKSDWEKQKLSLHKISAKATQDSNQPGQAQVCVGNTGNTCGANGQYVEIKSGKLYTETAATRRNGADKTEPQDLKIYVGSEAQAEQLATLDNMLITATTTPALTTPCDPADQLEDLKFLEDSAAATDPNHKRLKADSSNKQNLQMTVKSLYSDNPSDFKTKFWQTFDDLLVPTKTGNEIEKKKFSAISGVEQLRQSLELAAMMAIIENDTKKPTTCTAAVAASETTACSKQLKKTDCKESDGCEWISDSEEIGNHCKDKDDKKEVDKISATDCTATEEGKCDKTKCDWNAEKKQCKVKEGAVVISSVMKAPLLLAFLLFKFPPLFLAEIC
uniref:Variant surface glycoprotein 1125.538 n=1 Tax=Trypanosoma brucei TaxID=5691 RepID=A0A1J0R667_9TRYP|nr:variant surface glycoprotein 1125.538 [Trypanosoma brucei]